MLSKLNNIYKNKELKETSEIKPAYDKLGFSDGLGISITKKKILTEKKTKQQQKTCNEKKQVVHNPKQFIIFILGKENIPNKIKQTIHLLWIRVLSPPHPLIHIIKIKGIKIKDFLYPLAMTPPLGLIHFQSS